MAAIVALEAWMNPNPQRESLDRMAGAEAYSRWIVDRARPFLGESVLDVGAGTGTLTTILADDAEEVIAVEPDADLAPILRQKLAGRPNVTVVEHQAQELPELVREPVDSVVCVNVLEHIRDDVGALRIFRKLLRRDGRLLLLVPAHPRLYGAVDETVGHERRYRKETLAEPLLDAGFEIDDLRYVNPVGAIGWFASSRVLRRRHVPVGPLRVYDRLVPALRVLDRLRLPFGLSLWTVARRPEAAGLGR